MSAGADDPDEQRGERLQKYLARCGVASRRHAETLISDGLVTVNGAVVRELGARVDPERDAVRVRGQRVEAPSRLLYLLMNKPIGYVTTASDPHGRRTVLDLLSGRWRDARVYPVGRLDHNTEGLLLLTNDGDLALRLTHPRYALAKEYHAQVERKPSPDDLAALAGGMTLPGETRPTAPARAWLLRPGPDGEVWVGLELHEGRNRQARRMLDTVGCPVVRLLRVRAGPLTLGKLRAGETRELTLREAETLRRYAGLEPRAARQEERR